MIRRACIIGLLGLTASAAYGAPSYDHLYAFGDSYTDNGAGQAFTQTLVKQKVKDAQDLPGSLYWEGRWSNGPTAVENLATALKTPLTDYGVGGAKSGNGNYYAWMEPARNTGLLGQVDDHLRTASAQKADPKALYFIFISANDFFEWADFSHPESVQSLAETSVANIQKAVATLTAAGAKHFLVVGTTDLSHVPAVVQGNQIENAKSFQQVLEQQLPSALAKMAKVHNVKISFFDHLKFSNDIRANADEAGLTDPDRPCQATYPDVKPVCKNPDAHYYWDEWHPTRKIHALAAQGMLESLKTQN